MAEYSGCPYTASTLLSGSYPVDGAVGWHSSQWADTRAVAKQYRGRVQPRSSVRELSLCPGLHWHSKSSEGCWVSWRVGMQVAPSCLFSSDSWELPRAGWHMALGRVCVAEQREMSAGGLGGLGSHWYVGNGKWVLTHLWAEEIESHSCPIASSLTAVFHVNTGGRFPTDTGYLAVSRVSLISFVSSCPSVVMQSS